VYFLTYSRGMKKEATVLNFKIGIFYHSHLKVQRGCKKSVVWIPGIPIFCDQCPQAWLVVLFFWGWGGESSPLATPHKRTSRNIRCHPAIFFPPLHSIWGPTPLMQSGYRNAWRDSTNCNCAASKGLTKYCFVCKTCKTHGFQSLYIASTSYPVRAGSGW